MRVLVACEFSGIVREAFKARGHDAWSCDLMDSEIVGNHIKGDVLAILDQDWDLMIAHPPCTYLSVAGARHFASRDPRLQKDALAFVMLLLNAPIKKIAIENPVGVISTFIRPPDQYIQPYWFGAHTTKKTGLWLKNLPLLTKTNVIDPDKVRSGDFSMTMRTKDWRKRSRTFKGIASAMAEQWG